VGHLSALHGESDHEILPLPVSRKVNSVASRLITPAG
jgi:hypothetical protein